MDTPADNNKYNRWTFQLQKAIRKIVQFEPTLIPWEEIIIWQPDYKNYNRDNLDKQEKETITEEDGCKFCSDLLPVVYGHCIRTKQFNESLFIKNDFKPTKVKFSLTFLQVFQFVNDVKHHQHVLGECIFTRELNHQLGRKKKKKGGQSQLIVQKMAWLRAKKLDKAYDRFSPNSPNILFFSTRSQLPPPVDSGTPHHQAKSYPYLPVHRYSE
ncbi:hypothetical protein PROFUN_10128 [Planoprotostelium fungivorum]|uniref:Uncharacterized protein n=1 Tax=Planoprotostelium fungivorum TaxID=1890364 RepID=A0A2P6NEQ2_9EUKA|nr:hypothetical protein PROFUN_10128 [Planoprotostelium fungivorum]